MFSILVKKYNVYCYTGVEVYDFPEDCTVEELAYHFESEPYEATCLRNQEVDHSFLFEFSSQGETKP